MGNTNKQGKLKMQETDGKGEPVNGKKYLAAKKNPEAKGSSRDGTKYLPNSQHQMEAAYWKLLCAGRHPLVDTEITTPCSDNHNFTSR